ncbi:hypothetical protein BJL95_11405 [Methylomonas sp. LWB]|nr:hypothetical protein BJL95_11405 [Methylomonas sp. LWB]
MPIQHKLFLVLLMTTLLLVGGMFGILRWSLADSFNSYLERLQTDRVGRLVDSLRGCYVRHSGWDVLRKDRGHWVDLLWKANHHANPPDEFKALADFPEPEWPPKRLPGYGYGSNDAHFELRVMLLDESRRIAVGREDLIDKADLHPIVLEDQTVGYLALLKSKRKMNSTEISFFNQQSRTFTWITLGMVVLSFLMSIALAYWLGKPLKDIADVVRRLAAGDYRPRVNIGTRDALGGLAGDINQLALVLDQTEKLRRQWVADVSHELRTPLSILRAELEALQDGIRPLEPGAVDLLLNDVLRLSRLTDDLYQLALSDRQAMTYQYTRTEPLPILETLVRTLTTEFESRSLTLELAMPWLDKVKVWADPDRLAQLFGNLLINSLRYTDPGGCLRIAGHLDAGKLRLEFADSAPGVAVADFTNIFQRFYRVEMSRNRQHGGAGLGLALCQSIVEAHGGSIEAGPSELGGLRISVALPLLDNEK